MAHRQPVTIAVFAKAPVPGQVKTRLTSAVGKGVAAAVHKQMLEHAVITALEAKLGQVELWVTDVRHPFFKKFCGLRQLSVHQQPTGDLGQRMAFVFRNAGNSTLLVGTDTPTISPDLLRYCASELDHCSAVFLPAEDGGYGLVGLQGPRPELFVGVPWGSGRVMAVTRDKLRQLRIQWAEPRTVWDVDRPQDLDRLRASIKLRTFADG